MAAGWCASRSARCPPSASTSLPSGLFFVAKPNHPNREPDRETAINLHSAAQIFFFVFPLGLDTFALAIALGLRGFSPWTTALLFSSFEAAMPLFGIALARVVSERFESAAVVLGGITLIVIGIHAIRHALHGEAKEADRISFGSLRSALLAGLAISTDELAIGFPLGVSKLPIVTVLIAIFIQTFFLAVLGVIVGRRVRSAFALAASRYAGIAAGIVFSLAGVWLIAQRFAF